MSIVFSDAIDDYTPQNRLLRFTANQKKLCINIPIINDLRIEQRESFGIVLERSADTDHRISIHQDMGVVHIENDDGEIYMRLYIVYELQLIFHVLCCGWLSKIFNHIISWNGDEMLL